MTKLRRQDVAALALSALAAIACSTQSDNGRGEEAPFDLQFGLEDVLTVGDPDAFGQIADLVVDAGGNIYVLDGYNKKVLRFAGSGDLLATAGGEGGGPGEFRFPSAIAIFQDTTLFVLDPGNMRMSAIDVANEQLAFVDDITLPVPATDICVLGERLFLLGLSEGNALHEITTQGEIINSFGPPQDDDPIMQELTSAGYLICDDASGTIVFFPLAFPHVRAFSPSGEFRWGSELADYHQTVYERSDRGIRPRPAASGKVSGAVGSALLSSGVVLLQLRVLTATPGGEQSIDSRLLSLDSGTEIGRRDDLPQILHTNGALAYGYASDPYPRVTVYDIR